MRKGRIKNIMSGDVIDVTASTSHPDSSYGMPVWVDANNIAYMLCDAKNPFYEVIYDSDSERARVGKMIAEWRNNRGYSVRKLAELSGLSHSNITKIENGKYNVSVDILRKLCDALGVQITLIEKDAR